VSETLGLGTTEYVHIIRSGYSSRIFEISSVPIPAPVPPPRECVIWKPEDGVKNGTKHVTRESRRVSTAHLEGHRYPQPPSVRRQGQHRQVRHLPCSLRVCVKKTRVRKMMCHRHSVHSRPFAQLLPAPLWPNTKLSGRKRPPRGPDRTASMVPGSRSTKIARGTYLLAPISL
jgi:hypothetical protein